jgi:hypothetical protein
MTPQKALKLERRVLRALCGLPSAREAKAHAAQMEGHAWLDSEHRIVFEALKRLAARDRKAWRDELPAQATRMGFPEVEWRNYFGAKRPRRGDLEKRIDELTGNAAKVRR